MIIPFSFLRELRKRTNERIVFAGGTFDLLHPGHVQMIDGLKKYGDVVVIGVSRDKWVREQKGLQRPVQSQRARARMVDALKGVDYVFIYPQKNVKYAHPSMQVIHCLRPDVFVTVHSHWQSARSEIEKCHSTKLVIEKYRSKKYSTTRIINTIMNMLE